ncbi:MAG: chorismate synthase [Chloroflexi bacterium]|nr:chorismate synthase [Chloroflexota bacterium]
MGNSFGHLFRVTTFGESHGAAVGVVIDGCPPRLRVDADDIQRELDRRRPGQSNLTTARAESDRCQILSGIYQGQTLGTPIALLVPNEDARSKDYSELELKYRPSHADFTYDRKYGVRDHRGGGRTSARETVGRVAAGAIARRLLQARAGIEAIGYVLRVKDIQATVDPDTVTTAQVEATPTRCPDPQTAARMTELILAAKKAGDSVGGVVECVARNVPPGLGEPVFDRLEADLAKAVLSLPASKGFEIGSGFAGTELYGSEHNDEFYVDPSGRVRTRTNNSGGVQGGISNGEHIIIRVAFKPTATILREQRTVNKLGEETTLQGRGRHDPCVLPRAVPMVESMVLLVLADHWLRHQALVGPPPVEAAAHADVPV